MDDVSLHGKDNQQAVEILKQTGHLVRLKVARHVSRPLSKTRPPPTASIGSVGSEGTSLLDGQAVSTSAQAGKGMEHITIAQIVFFIRV